MRAASALHQSTRLHAFLYWRRKISLTCSGEVAIFIATGAVLWQTIVASVLCAVAFSLSGELQRDYATLTTHQRVFTRLLTFTETKAIDPDDMT